MSTRAMRVANIAFLLDRLAADTPPNQQIRELTQNALEAIARRHQTGDHAEGLILWDVDWDHLNHSDRYKLCITDNGDGMSPRQMDDYLNSLAVQGASETQSISQNFGVGAKITALFRNRWGLVYQSWRDGKGAMVRLHRDDKQGVYGLASFNLDDGPNWTPRVKDTAKPRAIISNGTKVTLLGVSDDDNTCFPAEDAGSGMNWLIRYLTNRYFRLPDGVKLQVRVLTKQEDKWPRREPPSGEKTFNLQTVRGMRSLLDDYSSERGNVRLSNAECHWWIFDDPRAASKDMSTRGGRTCQIGIIYQNEIYVQRSAQQARKILTSFGILFGSENIVIYLEPRESSGVRADTARSRVLISGEDVEDGNWWEVWGNEFKGQMPAAIKTKIEEIMARAEKDTSGKSRERILERLRRIRDLLRPSRYRRDTKGVREAAGRVAGGNAAVDDRPHEHHKSSSGKRGYGRSGDEYLAELVESAGEAASLINVSPKEPEVLWVSRVAGTRQEDELEDTAAEIAGDLLVGDIIKANADFRGFRDVVAFFSKEFNPAGDAAVQQKIVELIQEWMEGQLIESVMAVRALANGRTWTEHEIEKALSPFALTTVLMTRFHVIDRVRRAINAEIAKPSPVKSS